MKLQLSTVFLFCLLLSSFTGQGYDPFPIVVYPSSLTDGHQTKINVIIDPELRADGVLATLNSLNGSRFSTLNDADFFMLNQLSFHQTTLTDTDRANFLSYLKSIEDSTPLNGHDFNATAFNEGEEYVFSNITGRSYDADLALDWLSENVWDGVDNEYTLLLFNLTDLDEGMDHWFTIKPLDIDSGVMQTSFFAGTEGLFNGKSVNAWGGYRGEPLHFIDFSSDVWWGDFINTAYGGFGYSADLLAQKLQDFTTPEEQDDYLQKYTRSFIINTYDQGVFNGAPLGRDVKVQSLVLYDWYNYGFTMEDNRWLMDVEAIGDTFSNAFEWLEFNVTEEWYNLSAFNELQAEMDKYTTLSPDGEGFYIELTTGLYAYIQNTFIPENFDLTGEDIILPSLVIFLDNAVFTLGGLPIAGVSNGQFQLQGLNPDRYYDREGERNRGFSDVILHEVGHSLGLPHPFSSVDSWAGDMVASVMGYYTSAPDFSQYDVNALGFYHSFFYLMQADYIETQIESSDPLMPYIEEWIDLSHEAQEGWEFKVSIDYALLALCGFAEVTNVDDDRCDEIDLIDATQTTESTSPTTQSDTSSTELTNFILSPVFIVIIPVIQGMKRKHA